MPEKHRMPDDGGMPENRGTAENRGMAESPGGGSERRGPDHFDRLLARSAPALGMARPAHVRPRLPGPFERFEGGWGDPVEVADPVWGPTTPESPVGEGPHEPRHSVREIRIERETRIVREPSPADEPESPSRSPAPPLRPAAAAPQPPRGRPAAHREITAGPRRDDGSRGRDDGAVRAPVRPAVPGRAPSPRPVAPRTSQAVEASAAGRAAARTAPRRREPRPEPAIQVRIGRLEVRAAGSEPRPRPGPSRARRREPSVSLTDYLHEGRGA